MIIKRGRIIFVIVVTWPGQDIDGNRTIKFFCPSIDSAEHHAVEAAEAVQNVIQRLFMDEDIQVVAATPNSGGGSSIQNIHPELVRLRVIGEKSKAANCSLHGLQKSLENAAKKTMGDQGMGCRSPSQTLYVFSILMDTLRGKGGGVKLLDRLWTIIADEVLINKRWRSYANENF